MRSPDRLRMRRERYVTNEVVWTRGAQNKGARRAQLNKDRSQPHSSVPRDCFLRSSLALPHVAKKPANNVTMGGEVSSVVHRKCAGSNASLVACCDFTVKRRTLNPQSRWLETRVDSSEATLRPLLGSVLPAFRGMRTAVLDLHAKVHLSGIAVIIWSVWGQTGHYCAKMIQLKVRSSINLRRDVLPATHSRLTSH